MIEILKPCPFCGEMPRIIEHEYDGASNTYGVRCRCGAQSFQFYEEPSLAVNAWNARKAELHAWIPVTEALPDKDGRYLVTCTKWGEWSVDWNIWRNEPKPSWLWEQGITAWMPLPEPYEEVRRDD